MAGAKEVISDLILTLVGYDGFYNLDTMRSIELEGTRVVITYTGEGKNLVLDCEDASRSKALFNYLLTEFSQHHKVLHADPLSMSPLEV